MQKKLNVMQDCQSFWAHTQTMRVRRARPIPHLSVRVGGDHFSSPPLGTRGREWPYVSTDDAVYHLGHAGHNCRLPCLPSLQIWTLSAAGYTTDVGQGVCVSQEITQLTYFLKIFITYLPAKSGQATTFIRFLLIIFLVTDFLLIHNYLIIWSSHNSVMLT